MIDRESETAWNKDVGIRLTAIWLQVDLSSGLFVKPWRKQIWPVEGQLRGIRDGMN